MLKNLCYFGSPGFSAEILASLLKNPGVRVVGVVTQPDKPVGRKQILTPSPVAQLATENDIPTYKPAKLDQAHLAHIKLLKPDIFLTASYGQFMPPEWLTAPTIGTFNLHFSLLPKYRGALCIQEAIKNQDMQTGVTLMVMDELMDHGPIIAQKSVNIDPDDNVADLTQKLSLAGIELLSNHLDGLINNTYTPTPQDETLATTTPSLKTLTRQNAYISWEKISQFDLTTNALINSLNPEPGAWSEIDGQEIKILKTTAHNDHFEIDLVQVPGKNPTPWKQFLSGHKNIP